jgi:hypothetical protein
MKKLSPGLGWMNHQLHWIQGNDFQLVGPLRCHFFTQKSSCWMISRIRKHKVKKGKERKFKERQGKKNKGNHIQV